MFGNRTTRPPAGSHDSPEPIKPSAPGLSYEEHMQRLSKAKAWMEDLLREAEADGYSVNLHAINPGNTIGPCLFIDLSGRVK